MKKFYLIFFLFLTLNLHSQITINIDGQTNDLSGQTYTVIAPSNASFDIPFLINNNTGVTHQWSIVRLRIDAPTGWTDALCWGHATDPFGGTCYSSTQMNTNPWTTPASALFDINDGEHGKMKVSINPDDFVSGSAHYRYFISDGGHSYSDSVDLVVDFTAGISQVKDPINVSIIPNPADEYIQISMTGIDNASLKIVDVFGSAIMKENIGSTKKINISDYSNGVYFLVFDVQGKKSFTRKVIVRH